MDKQQILKTYKEKAEKPKLLKLEGGKAVIGTEVDEDNKLWYVIENGNVTTVERANKHKPLDNPVLSLKEAVLVNKGVIVKQSKQDDVKQK